MVGLRYGKWFLTKEGIRRCVYHEDGKRTLIRYPKSKYSGLSLDGIKRLIKRLNNETESEIIQTRLLFLPPNILEEFRSKLELEIPNPKDFRYSYNTIFLKYFIGFFTQTGNLDPLKWPKMQSQWAKALLENPGYPKSPKSHKYIIQIANRFMAFLHEQYPEEIPLYRFNPLSKARWKYREAYHSKNVGHYISDSDWTVIWEHCPEEIRPFVWLCYHYGLRRSEALGFRDTSVIRQGYLMIEWQKIKHNQYSVLKGRSKRKTPHWFASPKETYFWVKEGMKYCYHPDTFGKVFKDYVLRLYQNNHIKRIYTTHDFRRTFITRALRKAEPRDVQLAVGHVDLKTTMSYARDDRNLEDQVFIPDSL